jgi:predicted nucleotidyltransferase
MMMLIGAGPVNLSEPMLSVVPGVTGAVLAVLARTTEPLTGRTIAGRVKPRASQKGVANVLAHLVEAGIVDRVDKGRSALFTLNRDHISAEAVVELASLRQVLLSRFGEAIAAWAVAPVSATVFGSFARGEGGPESDIDLLLVRPPDADGQWGEQLTDLTLRARRWTGNPLNVIDIGTEELAALAEEPFVINATAEGITVAGMPLRRALRAARAAT